MSNFLVTITGADDEVDPVFLSMMSKEYPFVEWGVLFSETQPDTRRYPSKRWREALYAETMTAQHPISLSAHICGRMTNTILEKRSTLVTEVDLFYRRVQFNRTNDGNQKELMDYISNTSTQCILPCNKSTKSVLQSLTPEIYQKTSILFDASGGNGIEVETWPSHDDNFFRCGYAGGIKLGNIEKHLTTLTSRYGTKPFWIDLESGARDLQNDFCPTEVENLLKVAARFHVMTKDRVVQVPVKSSIILT